MAANENFPSDDPLDLGSEPERRKQDGLKPPTNTPVPEDEDDGLFDFNAVAPIVEGASGKLNIDDLPDPGSSPSLISWAEVIRQQREEQAEIGAAPADSIKLDSSSDKDLLDRIASEEGKAGERDTDKLKKVPLVGEEGPRSNSSLELGKQHDPAQASKPHSGSAVRFDIPEPPPDAGGAIPMPLDEEIIEALPLDDSDYSEVPVAKALPLEDDIIPLDEAESPAASVARSVQQGQEDDAADLLSLDNDVSSEAKAGKSSILDFLLAEGDSGNQRAAQADDLVSGPGSGVLSGLSSKSGIDFAEPPLPPTIEPGNSWRHAELLAPLMYEEQPPAGDSGVVPTAEAPVQEGDSWRSQMGGQPAEAAAHLPPPAASDSGINFGDGTPIDLSEISAIGAADPLPPQPAFDLTESVLSDPSIELPGARPDDTLSPPKAEHSWHSLNDVANAEEFVPAEPAAGSGDAWKQTMASFHLPEAGEEDLVDLTAMELPEPLPLDAGDSWKTAAESPPAEPATGAGRRATMASFELPPEGSQELIDLGFGAEPTLHGTSDVPLNAETAPVEPLPADDIDAGDSWIAASGPSKEPASSDAVNPWSTSPEDPTSGWGLGNRRQTMPQFKLPDEKGDDAVDIYGGGAIHQGISDSGSLRISDEEMEQAARKFKHAESSSIDLGTKQSSHELFNLNPPGQSGKVHSADETVDMDLPELDSPESGSSMIRNFEDLLPGSTPDEELVPPSDGDLAIAEAVEDEDPIAAQEVQPTSVPDLGQLFGEAATEANAVEPVEPAHDEWESAAQPAARSTALPHGLLPASEPDIGALFADSAEAEPIAAPAEEVVEEAAAAEPVEAFTPPPPPAPKRGRRGKREPEPVAEEPTETIAPLANLGAAEASNEEPFTAPAKRAPKAERPAKKGGGMLAGTAVGLLLGAGGLFAAYYFEVMPSPKSLIDGKDETPKTAINLPKPVADGNNNPRPVEAAVTPQSAQQYIDAGQPAKALAAYEKLENKEDAAVKVGMGQAQWLAYLQSQAADGKEPNRDDAKVKAALDHLKAAAEAAARDEKLEAEALRAVLWQAAIEESLDDYEAAEKIYSDAAENLKSPASKKALEAARNRLKVIGPEPKSPLGALPAQQLLLAFTLLLADPPGTPPADEPAGQEAGFLFWEAMVAARENRFDDAIKLLPQVKAVHARQRVKMAGKGLNPLSDPREQMLPAALDDLARYWALCQELYKRPEARMLVEQRKIPEALVAVFAKSKENDDAMKLIVEKLMPKADEKPVEAIEALITAKKKAQDDLKTAEDLKKLADDMIAAVTKSLKDAGIDEPKADEAVKKLIAGREDAENKVKALGEAIEKAGVKEPDTAKALAMIVASRDDAEAIVKAVRERFEKAKYIEANANRDAVMKAVDDAITRGATDALVKLAEEKKAAEAKAAKLEAEADKVKKDAEDAATKAKADADAAIKKALADAKATEDKAQKDLAALKAMYEGILQNAGKDFAAHVARSDELLKAGRYDAALREYIAGIKKLKALPEENANGLERILAAHPAMAKVNASEGDPSLALKHYSEGLEAFRDGRYDRAEREFASAVQFDNRDARYRYYLGMSRWLQNKADVATEDFKAAGQLEAMGRPNGRAVNASLQSIQGPLRNAVEKYRP